MSQSLSPDNNEKTPELVLVDKSAGVSSFRAVGITKKYFNVKKAGHAGTLDPQATGLLIVGLNAGTKKLTALVGVDKEYRAEITIGVATDSWDGEGRVTEQKNVFELDNYAVETILKQLEGEHLLLVPIFSATKQGGEALYKKARRGDRLVQPQRQMTFYWLRLLDLYPRDNGTFVLSVQCKVSSGTYIRSLAHAIGEGLGLPAHLSGLRRTVVGHYSVLDAYKLDDLQKNRSASLNDN